MRRYPEGEGGLGKPRIYASVKEANVDLAYWQAVLGLRDWDVKLKIVRFEDMQPKGAVAGISRYPSHRCAVLMVLDPVDNNQIGNPECWPQDHEYDIVHELLHLHVEESFDVVFDADEKLWWRVDTAKERMINALARTLINLRRKSA
jgi:hypothetical protein